MDIKFGLDTFGDMQVDDSGKPISAAQTIRNVVEEAVFADSMGIFGINLGEHHRDDFAISAPDTAFANSMPNMPWPAEISSTFFGASPANSRAAMPATVPVMGAMCCAKSTQKPSS